MKSREQQLYIIILEQKRSLIGDEPLQRPLRTIHCITPDTKSLLGFYAHTYQKFYWCNEFAMSSANKHIVFFDIYQKITQKDILKDYVQWFGEMMGRFISYANSFISLTQGKTMKEQFCGYVRLTLSRKKSLWEAIKKAFGFGEEEEMISLFRSIVHSLYYIATRVMGYNLPFDIPLTNTQNN